MAVFMSLTKHVVYLRGEMCGVVYADDDTQLERLFPGGVYAGELGCPDCLGHFGVGAAHDPVQHDELARFLEAKNMVDSRERHEGVKMAIIHLQRERAQHEWVLRNIAHAAIGEELEEETSQVWQSHLPVPYVPKWSTLQRAAL